MPETVAYLSAVVGADITSFRRAMAQVRGDLTGMHTGISQSLRNVGRDMTYALTVPLAAIGAASVKLASDFDAALRNIASISPDFAANFDEMGQKILEFGSRTRSGAQAAAEAFYQITSAGILDANDAFAIMEQSVFTAEAGLADLTATTKGLTSALLAFDAASDPTFANMSEAAEHYGNVLTRAVQLGVGSMNEFVPALGRAAASAAMAGSSYDQLASSAAFLTQRGITVYNAGTAMNNVFNKLISPTDALRAAFTRLGVTTSQELFDKFGDLQGVLRALEGVFGDSAEKWGEAFNSIQAKRAIFGIMNNFEDFEQFMKDFNNGLDTATQSAWTEQMKSFEGQVGLMSSAIKGLAIQIGQVLLPILLPLIQQITTFFQQAMQLNPELLKLIMGFAGLAAAMGPLLWIFGTILSPMGLLITGVAALGLAISQNFDGIRTSIENTVNTVVPSLGRLLGVLGDFINFVITEPTKPTWGIPTQVWQGGTGTTTNFSVKPGDTAWGLQDSTGLTWQQILEAAGVERGQDLKPGDYSYTSGGGGSMVPYDFAMPESNIGTRLAAAWSRFGASITEAISGMITEVVTWVETDGVTELDRIVSAIFDTLGGLFEGNTTYTEGENGISNGVEAMIAGGFGDAATAIGDELTRIFPRATESIGTFLDDLKEWMTNTGLPTIANIAGFLLTSLVIAIIDIVEGLFGGVGKEGKLAQNIRQSFERGISDALKNANIDENSAEAVVTKMGVAIVTALGAIKLAGGAAGALGFGGIASAVGGLIGNGLKGIILGNPVIAGIIAGITLKNLIPQEQWDRMIIDLFNWLGWDGEKVLTDFRRVVEVGLTALFNGIKGWIDAATILGDNPEILNVISEALALALNNAAASIGQQGSILQIAIQAFSDTFGDTLVGSIAESVTEQFQSDSTLSDIFRFLFPDPNATGGGEGTVQSKRASGGGNKGAGGPMSPFFEQLKIDVQTGMTSVNTEFTNQFLTLGTTLTTGVTGVQLNLNALVLAIIASIPLMAVALAGFNLTVLIGMTALLLTVTTFADLIIAKWNEMLMTMGSAPVNVGYTPGGMYGGAGAAGGGGTTNIYVKTDNPNKLNDSFKKAGTSVYEGQSGVRTVWR